MKLKCTQLSGSGSSPPITYTYTPGTNAQILMVSGCAHSQEDARTIGLVVKTGGNVVARSNMRVNTKFNRHALPAVMVPLDLAAGTAHTLSLERDSDYPDTRTDDEDSFSVSIAELDQSTTL